MANLALVNGHFRHILYRQFSLLLKIRKAYNENFYGEFSHRFRQQLNRQLPVLLVIKYVHTTIWVHNDHLPPVTGGGAMLF